MKLKAEKQLKFVRKLQVTSCRQIIKMENKLTSMSIAVQVCYIRKLQKNSLI